MIRELVAGALEAVSGKSHAPHCHHRSAKGDPCPERPTHRATWPAHSHRPRRADYCETHAEEIRRTPNLELTPLEEKHER
jgi:hypothetical protein